MDYFLLHANKDEEIIKTDKCIILDLDQTFIATQDNDQYETFKNMNIYKNKKAFLAVCCTFALAKERVAASHKKRSCDKSKTLSFYDKLRPHY